MAQFKSKRDPKYRRQKKANGDLAFVELDGVRHYLGQYNSNESREAYHRILTEWRASGLSPEPGIRGSITVIEVIAAYWRHAQEHYRKADGRPTGEADNIRRALGYVRRLYGSTKVHEFGPVRLKAARQAMIESGYTRGSINQNVGRVKRMFRWAVENELIDPKVYHGLQAVAGLRRGRSAALETERIRPAPDAHVDALQQFVSRQVWAMIDLQRLTGMRPGEVVALRGCDVDTTGTPWVYTPADHKTEHHGHDRKIYLGPRAKEILKRFLKPDLQAPLFSPADAESERSAQRRANRKSTMTPSQAARHPAENRSRPPRDRYDVPSYRRAIQRACKKTGVPKWHPHQLRHNAATRLRKEYGLDAARTVLGHRTPMVTELYAEIDQAKAAEVMLKIG